ncbi:hypothetical protein QVD17_21395 [Tagetes erecta]|uniref:Uncharacterized protein n=1 Tax=Tagetes erecta TaxID=13708 RepID=A0AAD8NT47_TARER|nr:hypothetical protein QVD17_21395 [Tagetes erecta]
MGCFVSTNKHYQSSKCSQPLSSSTSSRAPPPVDVETVKEVLTETSPTPFIQTEDDPKNMSSSPQHHIVLEDANVSETGSIISENISTTTFDDYEDSDVYRRKLIDRSPAKINNRNQASGELHPVRKTKSPGRVSPDRVKPGRISPGRVKQVGDRNGRESGVGSAGRQRPISGNAAVARSRSPGKSVAVGGGGSRNEIGRSLSGRRTGKSPGRVGSDLHERIRRPELRSGREREQSRRFSNGVKKDESLENPLVSLECFIFL